MRNEDERMKKSEGGLTELEGAVLSEIHHRGNSTAFQVRKAFQVSPSLEWSGSAGAVYPAIQRLVAAGLIDAETQTTGRRTSTLSLTSIGVERLEDWICDPVRAASVGLDPFRLRSGMWAHLAPGRRMEALRGLETHVRAEIETLKTYAATLDTVERARIELSIMLNETRLIWLARALAKEQVA